MDNPIAFLSETYDGTVWKSSYQHPNSLGYCVKELSMDDFDVAIRLAVSAIHSLKESANKVQYKEALSQEIARVLEEHNKEKEKLVSKGNLEKEKLVSSHSLQIQELELQIQKLKASLSVADLTTGKLREQLQSSGSLFESSLQEVGRQKEVQYEKELERLERVYKERLESMRVVFQEQEDKLRKQVERTLVSSEKGKQGEKEFDELASQYTSWGMLQNTSKSAHSTDREARIRGCGVRFEIKNYAGEVPTSEVTKFERDMEENHDYPLGVFVSLKSGICNRKSEGFVCIRWTSRNQMLLYINKFYEHSLEDVFRIIDMNIDIARLVYETCKKNEEDNTTELSTLLQSRIEQAKIYIEKEIQRMERFQITVTQQQKFLVETIGKHQVENTYNITQCSFALRGVLELLLGTGKKEDIVISSPIETEQVTILTPSVPINLKKAPPKKKKKEVLLVEGDGAL
jgi:hypothetical protein